uniref:RNA polymerase Rpb4/RPC9 core domain-containing protein n=3 Tax=Aegilops tauschii subsp. strangulata TaxID=200361 RepID=A0A453IJP4_AEGTS
HLSSNADSSRLPSPPLVVGTVVLAQSKARSSPLSSPPPNAPEHASSLPPRLTIAPLFPDLPAVTAFSRRRRSQPPRRPDQDHDAAVSEHTDRDTGRSNLHRPSPVQSSPNTASTLHSTMKIEKANAGHLTNFEVLDFLRTRGAKTDPMGCLGAVAASECKVYEYLLKIPACNQTRESVTEFANRCEGFKLTDADKQNIINWRPTSVADVYAVLPCLFC